MTKYELKKDTIELKNIGEYYPGCVLDKNDADPVLLESFNNKDNALNALKKYKTGVRDLSSHGIKYVLVTEYYIEESEYNEDGDWIGGGDILDYSKM